MKHLALGPGAIGYFSMLGAVNKLWDSGALHDLETISGASAGALLAVMIAVFKFDFEKILQASLDVPIHQLKPKIKTLLVSYGLIPITTTQKMIRDVIPDMTFKELYERFEKKVYISAYCVEVTKTHYFSVDSHPDMSIIDAVCMSISVPFLFAACTHGDWHYLDGGAAESAPCAPYLGVPYEDVYVIRLDYGNDCEIKDFRGYMSLILSSILKIRHNYDFPTCFLDLGETDIFDFSVTNELKMRLYALGYERVKVPLTFLRLCTTCRQACTCHSQTPVSELRQDLDNPAKKCAPRDIPDHSSQILQDVQDPCAL